MQNMIDSIDHKEPLIKIPEKRTQSFGLFFAQESLPTRIIH